MTPLVVPKTTAAIESDNKRDVLNPPSAFFHTDSPAIADSSYEGIRFSGSIDKDEALFYVFHPDVGLRLYAVCVFGGAVPEKVKKEAEAMAVSAEFDNVTAVYAKYMSATEEAEENKEE